MVADEEVGIATVEGGTVVTGIADSAAAITADWWGDADADDADDDEEDDADGSTAAAEAAGPERLATGGKLPAWRGFACGECSIGTIGTDTPP